MTWYVTNDNSQNASFPLSLITSVGASSNGSDDMLSDDRLADRLTYLLRSAQIAVLPPY